MSADMSVTKAARLALGERLPLVWHYLPLAAEHHRENVEYVHQLRVATRRAAAAINVFTDTLPKRRRRWFVRQLKHIRRAAAKARDLDVLSQRLIQQHPSGYEAVFDEIERHRSAAQEPVVYVYERIADKRFVLRAGELIDRARWRGRGSTPKMAKAARRVLRPIVRRFPRGSTGTSAGDGTCTCSRRPMNTVGDVWTSWRAIPSCPSRRSPLEGSEPGRKDNLFRHLYRDKEDGAWPLASTWY